MAIEQTCTLVENLSECLISLRAARYPATEDGLLAFFNQQLHGVLRSFDLGEVSAVLRPAPPGWVYEVALRLGSVVLILPLPNCQLWIIGSCMTQPVNSEFLLSVIKRNRGLISNPSMLTSDLRGLPQLPPGRLRWLGMLLAGQIYPGAELDYVCIEDNASDTVPQMVDEYANILPMRILEDRYGISRVLSSAVSTGNFSLAYRAYQALRPSISQLQRSSSALRSAQNLGIILNTILRLAAEDGGVHPYELDQLSSEVSCQIESAHTPEELSSYGEEVLRRYCTLVGELACPNASPVVRRAAAYVSANLSDSLTTRQMAKLLNLNSEYFSHRFSKETGTTFTEYINRARARQAAILLQTTQLPVQEVATASGFNSASYFIKKFHSIYGMTPTVYRQAGGRQQNWQE